MSAPLFPLFLRLAGRHVLVVGGGRLAALRLHGLLEAGAEITLVAPQACDEIEASGVRIERRAFVPSDLDGAWLAVAAATREANRAVLAAAESRRVFVNAVDDAAAASAFTAGVLRRGGVTLAVSTQGEAPALAGLLREALEALLPEQLGAWVATARALRDEQRAAGIPIERRRPALLEALNRLYAEART